MDEHRTTRDAGPEPRTRWFERAATPPDSRPAPPPRPGTTRPHGERNETAETVSRAIRWTYR